MKLPSLTSTLPALRQPLFRAYFLGQTVSTMGTWMQSIALSWLVLELGATPFALGLAQGLQFLPLLLLSLPAGSLLDRWPKARILVFTQSGLAILSLVLAVLVFFGVQSIGLVYAFSALFGLFQTLDIPARQAIVVELSGREHLVQAVSLNSTVFNMARVTGPALAAGLISWIGIAPCFLLNGLSFVPVILVILGMALKKSPVHGQIQAEVANSPGRPGGKDGVFQSLPEVNRHIREGLGIVRHNPLLLAPLVLLACMSCIVINYNVLVPVFAKTAMTGHVGDFGALMSAMGVGSMLAALSLALWARQAASFPLIILAALGMSLGLGLCGTQTDPLFSLGILGLTGFFSVRCTAGCNALLQSTAADSTRGRVMSLFSLVFAGVTPLGSLVSGALVEALGVGPAMVVLGAGGVVSVLAIAWVFRTIVFAPRPGAGLGSLPPVPNEATAVPGEPGAPEVLAQGPKPESLP